MVRKEKQSLEKELQDLLTQASFILKDLVRKLLFTWKMILGDVNEH